jgi:hypothetical protein
MDEDDMGSVCGIFVGERHACRVCCAKLKGGDHWEGLGLVGMIVLNFISKKWMGGCRLDVCGSG